jgi:DNA repair exonuclease SbcCD nuclease subunit
MSSENEYEEVEVDVEEGETAIVTESEASEVEETEELEELEEIEEVEDDEKVEEVSDKEDSELGDDKSGDELDDDVFNGFFVVGDIHFRSKHVLEAEEFMTKCLQKIDDTYPSAIILLGDVLDTHEVARNVPFKLACSFIEKCAEKAPTFVIVGNHDYINNSQYLTDNHFFVPLKKWPNVFIIDKPTKFEISDVKFMLCPYVPNGRFIESIASVYGRKWDTGINVVFAHQEIRGVNLRSSGFEESTKGDSYGAGFPPLISGHIHHPQFISPNIYYPGSAMQIASDEDPDKHVWLVNVDEMSENGLDIEKYSLDLKGIKTVYSTVDRIDGEFDWSLPEKYYIRLRLSGTPEQFKVFRKTKLYAKLIDAGVRIAFEPQISTRIGNTRHLTSFIDVMNELVKTRSNDVQSEFENIKNDVVSQNDAPVFEFVDEEEDE